MMHARRGLAVCTHLDHASVEGRPLWELSAESWADLFTTSGEDQHAD
jgi:hypothetical protein